MLSRCRARFGRKRRPRNVRIHCPIIPESGSGSVDREVHQTEIGGGNGRLTDAVVMGIFRQVILLAVVNIVFQRARGGTAGQGIASGGTGRFDISDDRVTDGRAKRRIEEEMPRVGGNIHGRAAVGSHKGGQGGCGATGIDGIVTIAAGIIPDAARVIGRHQLDRG